MNKIEALQKTIYNLENDVYEYSWINTGSCNCGILARTLLDGKDIYSEGYGNVPKTGKGIFASRAHCLKTGIPLPKVFQLLKDSGFTYEELLELEFLGNHKIANRIGLEINNYDGFSEGENYHDKPTLIKYLKAWVEILKEVQPQPIPEVKEVIRYCTISETLKSPIPETQLN